ncbi:HNH endonuclease [Nocardia asteroides]|uniref:HNH endonuclease n=1 Tax=Nocardia asteroides TaxID=1824 RepID=UPI0037C573B4
MLLASLTYPYVLDAIAECDRLGREEFLKTHGFAKAHEYFLLHGGRAYDSKAIVGVAYSLMVGEKHTAKDFSGGRVLADRLRLLGFEVTGDMDWKLEEQILACDLLYENGWLTIPERDQRVVELSKFLRSQWVYSGSIPEYRSTNSVHRKIEDLRTAHPDHAGTATRGGRLSAQVARAFATDPAKMHAVALNLQSNRQLDLPLDYTTDETEEDQSPLDESASVEDLVTAVEGRELRRMVRVYERDPKLRQQKIALSRKNRGSIACEVCGFDFEHAYPGRGDGYVEVHHVMPLHTTGAKMNGVDDLVLLCSNCHRMIHRRANWLTPDELRAIVVPMPVGGKA